MRSTSRKDFLDHIAAQAKVKGQRPGRDRPGDAGARPTCPAGSVDLVFLCDVYHHLEDHEKVLSSIHRALRPGGSLVLVEFDRVEGKSSDFVLKHIRAGQAEFRKRDRIGGFRVRSRPRPGPKLKENFFARFTRRGKGPMAVRRGLRRAGARVRPQSNSGSGHPSTGRQDRDDRQRCGKPSGSPSVSIAFVAFKPTAGRSCDRAEVDARPRRTPGSRRHARTGRFLPDRWHAGPTAHATRSASPPPRFDKPAGGRPG